MSAADAPSEPLAGSSAPRRRRISLTDLASASPDELPDVARELRTLRRILELNRRLARIDDESALLDELLDGANAILGSERAFLLALTAEDGGVRTLRERHLAGDTAAELERGASGDGASVPLALAALRDGEDIVVEHLARDPRFGGTTTTNHAGARSVLCVAVRIPDPCALYLDARGDESAFASADAELARRLMEQAAVSIERIRLLTQNRAQRDELLAAAKNAERLNHRLAEHLTRRTTELREAREDLALVAGADGLRHRYPEIVGRGPAMTATLRQIDRIAETDVPVLVEGESGTGKELLARALHASSARSSARFVAENCAALPDSLLENELFGHERGAFTGADAAAPGLFERADGGTLFLDEVGDMSPSLQKRLLRVLQEREVRRVGGSSVRKIDVRIVTATNRDLLALVREGRFREDLYYRLAVVKVRVPPLRERKEDVPLLVEHCLRRFRGKGAIPAVTAAAMDLLCAYDWPGNVRQLENEMRRAGALARGDVDVDLLSADVKTPRTPSAPRADGVLAADGSLALDPAFHATLALIASDGPLRELVEALEIARLQVVLAREGGNITRAADSLGLSRLGLRKKMARYEITKDGGPAANEPIAAAPTDPRKTVAPAPRQGDSGKES